MTDFPNQAKRRCSLKTKTATWSRLEEELIQTHLSVLIRGIRQSPGDFSNHLRGERKKKRSACEGQAVSKPIISSDFPKHPQLDLLTWERRRQFLVITRQNWVGTRRPDQQNPPQMKLEGGLEVMGAAKPRLRRFHSSIKDELTYRRRRDIKTVSGQSSLRLQMEEHF